MKIKRVTGTLCIASLVAAVSLSGCTDSAAARHEIGCVAGTMGGMAIGGAIGNRFGGGSGQTLATGVGAIAGGVASATALEC
ncbi:hypothetical protein QO034_02700 [Sedimentitalea sp. JM2-8]|uniref:17 kDa surface antigen n=1 Tax=Sedimentitalea xiamensis TaxID=3050037 RepID=A0ABT7FA73_9RHOB|nr:hypothetical protein [Sedimentitalea xiamensis]MDK3072008.1 hypothetical protein [Sedimentitalea xiamensis]